MIRKRREFTLKQAYEATFCRLVVADSITKVCGTLNLHQNPSMQLRLLLATAALLLSSACVFSQLVPNQEYLDHSQHQTIISSYEVIDSSIVYVVENEERGQVNTQIKIVRPSGVVTSVLSEALPFESNSQIFKDSQGNTRVLVYDLVNAGFDSFSSDFVDVTVKEDGSFRSKWVSNDFIISLETIFSMTIDSADVVYALTSYPRLQIFEEDSLMDERMLSSISHRESLFSNKNGQPYFISDTIYALNGLEMTAIQVLDEPAVEVKSIGNDNWIRHEGGGLSVYNSDFSNLLARPQLAFQLGSLALIDYHDDKIYLAEQSGDLTIHELLTFDSTRIVFSITEDLALSTHLNVTSDSSFVTAGQYVIPDISTQGILREYGTETAFAPMRHNVSIDYFNLNYLGDTTIQGGPTDLFKYGVNYELTNQSSQNSNCLDVFTSNLRPQLPGHVIYQDKSRSVLQPSGSLIKDTIKILSYNHPEESYAAIPGIDNKVNLAQPIQINVTTSTEELISAAEISVYPNPFSEELNLANVSASSSALLYTLDGQLIRQWTNAPNSLSGRDLPPGAYFIVIHGFGHTQVLPVVKL